MYAYCTVKSDRIWVLRLLNVCRFSIEKKICEMSRRDARAFSFNFFFISIEINIENG